MSQLLPTKHHISQSVRDTALESLSAGSKRVRRSSNVSGFVEFDEIYLCVGVQHTQWKIDETFSFRVNFGALPKRMLDPHWTGFERKYPTVLDCVYQSRLHPEHGCGEFWWDIVKPSDFDHATVQVRAACEQIMIEIYPTISTMETCVEAFNVRGPAWRAKLDQWLQAHA